MKKTYITLFFSCLQLFAFAQTGYTVKGEISGLKDGPIQLKRTFDNELINETRSVGGIFKIEHPGDFVGEKTYLSQGDLTWHFPIYLDPGVIQVKGDLKAIEVTGTISNESYREFVRGETSIKAIIDSLKRLKTALTDPIDIKRIDEEMLRTSRQMYSKLRDRIVRDFPGSVLAVEFLSAGIGQLAYADLKKHISVLDWQMNENWYTNRLLERLEILDRTQIGNVLPDFIVPDTVGAPFQLSSLRGKYVLVDFWASWCKPCRAENVHVKELYSKYHEQGFDVVGVSIDHVKSNWIKAIEDDQLPWHQVSNLVGWKCETAVGLGVALGMSGVPYTILIDREGRVIGHNLRGKALADMLAALFVSHL